MKTLIKITSFVAFPFVGWLLYGLYFAYTITRKSHHKVSDIKKLNQNRVQDITLHTNDGLKISGWYIPKNTGKAVILLAGRGCNRTTCLEQAKMYLQKEYSVLLPDLRGTGKSDGSRISFGWYERNDLLACYDFLKEKGYSAVAAHGYSLGAATICYSMKKITDFEFVVLEACYSNFGKLLHNVMKTKGLPLKLAFSAQYFGEQLIGIKFKILCPQEFIKHATSPTLIMGGDPEYLVHKQDTITLYNNCNATLKQIHLFRRSLHENFLLKYRNEYLHTIEKFLTAVEQNKLITNNPNEPKPITNFVAPTLTPPIQLPPKNKNANILQWFKRPLSLLKNTFQKSNSSSNKYGTTPYK